MKYYRGVSWDLSCSTFLSPTRSRGEEGHLVKWPGGNFMQFSIDKHKVQQPGLSLPPPSQYYGDDCQGAALQTQPWRTWLHKSLHDPGSNEGQQHPGLHEQELCPGKLSPHCAQHSLDHISITEASLGPFSTRQAPQTRESNKGTHDGREWLLLARECDGEPSCAVCSCEEQSERTSSGQEKPWQLCAVPGTQKLSGAHMVMCLWFVLVYLLSTTFLFTWEPFTCIVCITW